MQLISNKIKVLLLTIAVLITVVGTVSTLQQLTRFDHTFNIITGAPSFSFGETNITVASVTSLTLIGANGTAINFGTGSINGSCNVCQMDSNGVSSNGFSNGSNTSQSNQATCCVDFSVPTAGFLLENTGNTNLSVGYTCTGNCSFATFLGGTRSRGMGGLEIKVTANSVAAQTGEEGILDTSASCRGGGTLYRSISWNITNASAFDPTPGVCAATTGAPSGICTGFGEATYTSLGRNHYLCGNSSNFPLMFDNTQDAGVVDFNLTVLIDAFATGTRSSFRITFNGSSSG